jgi:hypothetical protein
MAGYRLTDRTVPLIGAVLLGLNRWLRLGPFLFFHLWKTLDQLKEKHITTLGGLVKWQIGRLIVDFFEC